MSQFLTNLSVNISETDIAKKGNISYLSAASALRAAGLPAHHYVDWHDDQGNAVPYLGMLGGAVVGVDMPISESLIQRTLLPVLDSSNRSIPFKDLTISDVNNARQRCLVKAIATTSGIGMSLFLGLDGDGEKAAAVLGLNKNSTLHSAEPVVSKLSNGVPYLAWNHALAAAKIVDPNFTWRIVTHGEGHLPFREVLGSVMLDIETTFKGSTQVLSMPVMNESFDAIPTSRINTWVWNRTAMRALAKAIAFHTGYGLGLYADEFGIEGEEGAVSAPTPATKPAPKAKKATPKAKAAPAVEPEVVAEEPVVGTPVVEVETPIEVIEAEAPAEDAAQATLLPEPTPEPKVEVEVQTQTPEQAVEPEAPVEQVAPEAAPTTEVKESSEDSPKKEPSPEELRHARMSHILSSRWDHVEKTNAMIPLFTSLQNSKKFSDEEKPLCFNQLLKGIQWAVNKREVRFNPLMLCHEITQTNAMQYLNEDELAVFHHKVLPPLFDEALLMGDDTLAQLPDMLVNARIVTDLGEMFTVGLEAGVPQSTFDLLGNLMG